MKQEKHSNIIHRDGSEVNVDDSDYADDVDKEDDDDDDLNDETTEDGTGAERRRDEVGEVRKMSSKDSLRLSLWRLVVTCVLLLTAFAVTYTTFILLMKQEDKNFSTAVCFKLLSYLHLSSTLSQNTMAIFDTYGTVRFLLYVLACTSAKILSLFSISLNNLLAPWVMLLSINNCRCASLMLVLQTSFRLQLGKKMRRGLCTVYQALNFLLVKFDNKVGRNSLVALTW
jgi:hypothetical protein